VSVDLAADLTQRDSQPVAASRSDIRAPLFVARVLNDHLAPALGGAPLILVSGISCHHNSDPTGYDKRGVRSRYSAELGQAGTFPKRIAVRRRPCDTAARCRGNFAVARM
jgi:hypothetical protein